jgi:hypothetical protein
MKYSYLVVVICLGCLFSTCKPEFDLNAPYKDVPVVYGILNYKDTIHYVKIYKGFQPKATGAAFIDAQNPDSIYYYDNIQVVLEEYDANDKRTSRPDIPLSITHDFPRDSGVFYYKEDRIIYCTTATLDKNKIYNIRITNKLNGNVTTGKTPIVGDFSIQNMSSQFNMLSKKSGVSFSPAPNAAEGVGYEIHVNFVYFEVDKRTKEVVKIDKIVKNISSALGEEYKMNNYEEFYKEFFTTFYSDIAARLKPDNDVIRYIGRPEQTGVCIEVEAWAAGESLFNFLLANKPSPSFVQVNNIYTNLTSTEGKAFGFFSSRYKTPIRRFGVTAESEDSLIAGPKTGHLGFRSYLEYKP